jgi:two-component system cell cycle sensor histidine kinase/response regulator CckA
VTRVGGLLFLESQIGKGTTFSLCLPAHLQEPQPEGIQSLPTTDKVVKTLPRDLAPVPATLRVLVLDDEPLIRTQVARLLVHDGYEPVLAEDLSEAISALQDAPVRGAIIDFMMPEQTGDVALQILRTYQANLPAVLISGYIGPRDESVTRDFSAVILKPFSQDDFQTTIQRVIPKPSVA